jgi:hypothetical protein
MIMIKVIKMGKKLREQGGIEGNRRKKGVKGGRRDNGVAGSEKDQKSLAAGEGFSAIIQGLIEWLQRPTQG